MLLYLENPGFPGCEVCCLFCSELLLDMFWRIVGKLMYTNKIHSSLSMYNALSKAFAIEILLKKFATEETL